MGQSFRCGRSLRQPRPKKSCSPGALGAPSGVSAYRLYDRDLPEYALTIDHYGVALAVQTYEAPNSIDPAQAALRQKAALALLPEASGVEAGAHYLRERRRTSPESQYGVASRAQERVQVIEGPAKFWVNLSDYLDTGLYLDSRGVRRVIGEYLRILRARRARQGRGGPRLLNLFSYTGPPPYRAPSREHKKAYRSIFLEPI